MDRVHSLVLSLREFGGALSSAPVVVNFVGDVAAEHARALEQLRVDLRVVPAQDARTGFANKLHMLELHHEHEFDVLVALDCDTVVVGDFSRYLSPEALAAKPVDYDRLSEREWSRLLTGVGISTPPKTMQATSTGVSIYPYFNTGVLLVPRAMCAELDERWRTRNTQVLDLIDEHPDVLRSELLFCVDQLSLAVVLMENRLRYRTLPVTLNFPTHVPVHRFARPGGKPLILHYHRERDARGFLLAAREAVANEQIHRFNACRARALGLHYDRLPRRRLSDRLRYAVRHRQHAGIPRLRFGSP